nr:PREDICTED: fibronectin type-III domain-containing protein 3A-like [Lepisosteus oculatus]
MNGAAEVGELQGSPELELGSGLIKDAPSLFCSSSQVILVQVNPGETFTIRTEDGHIQCIPGPAHVPMVSPNGSMPPIFLPPGYMSQVVEENGMRKVVVLPHSAEFHHSMAHPHPHVPPYLPPHPALLHHHHVYPPVPATGELPPHFLPQHPPPQIYSDQEAAAHGRGGTGLSRDDRAAKTQESLRKRLKDRPLCAKAGGSPPPLPHNGCGKGHAGAPAPCNPKSAARPRATPPAEGDSTEAEVKGLVEQLSSVAKPVVCSVSPRSAMLSWSSPLGPRDSDSEAPSAHSLSYELALSHAGRSADYSPIYVCAYLPLLFQAPSDNGSKIAGYLLEYDEGNQSAFKEVYFGHMKQFKVIRLTPSTKYAFRLAAKNDIGLSAFSEVLTCCTSGCVPSPPAPPRLAGAGVSWLALEWSTPSGLSGEESLTYTLEMEEEGSGYGFKPKHNGEELSCTLKNLRRSTSYRFRLFAANVEGRSQPSAPVEFSTSPDKPGPPGRPTVKGRVHAHRVHTVWDAPRDSGGSEVTKYVLEISENLNGNPWEMVYSGLAREHVCDRLSPGSWYRLRVYCLGAGGQSQASDVLTVQTAAVPPGPCQPLCLVGRPKPREIPLRWGPPLQDGGAPVSQFAVEMADSAQGPRQQLYEGPETECTASDLRPGRTYCFWVKAANQAGWGPLSEMWETPTAPGAPEQCDAPQLTVRTATCVLAAWERPGCNGAEISEFRLECGAAQGSLQLAYCGPALSYELRGLTPATTYFCRVQSACVCGRFVCIYSGPCHTYKLQRLGEATVYHFRIQAQSEAGVGPLSPVYSFRTAKSPPAQLRAPKVQHLDGSLCEVTWEGLPPMRGDPIVYALQLTRGREAEQLYKGPDSSFLWRGAAAGGEYRLRVCAARRCQDSGEPLELWGQYSPGTLFSCPEPAGVPPGRPATAAGRGPPARGAPLSDEQFALLLLLGFAVVAVLFAVVIQYFVIK